MIRSQRLLWLFTAGALLFYFRYVFRFAQDVPFWDDYDAILLALSTLHDSGDWARYLFQPHNEHVVLWVRLAAWLQLLLFGEVNFRHLIVLGNLFIAGIFMLWCLVIAQSFKAAANSQQAAPTQMAGIALIGALLLFSIAYWESNLWAMAALSNFPVLFFALAALLVFHHGDNDRTLFGAALLCVLAALSQANGLFVFAVIGLRLVQMRKWARALLWGILSVAAFACYISLRHMNPPAAAKYSASVWEVLLFFLRFLGSFIPHLHAALWLGVLILALLVLAVVCRRREQTPVLHSILLFLFITAAVTAYSRVSDWAEGALASRYSINSALLMMAVVCLYAHWIVASRIRLLVLVLLAAAANVTDYEYMRTRFVQRYVESEKLLEPSLSCARHFSYPDQGRAREIYQRAEQLGIYSAKLKLGAPCEMLKLELVEGVRPTPLASGTGGMIDGWKVDGYRLTVHGWLGLRNLDARPQLLVAVPNLPFRTSLQRVQRNDVAVGMRSTDYLNSGFSLVMDFASDEQVQAAIKGSCLAFSSVRLQSVILLPAADHHCDGYLTGAPPAAISSRPATP